MKHRIVLYFEFEAEDISDALNKYEENVKVDSEIEHYIKCVTRIEEDDGDVE